MLFRSKEGRVIQESISESARRKDFEDEESVIQAKSHDSETISTPSLKSNIPSATVEEKIDFEWKAESKEVSHQSALKDGFSDQFKENIQPKVIQKVREDRQLQRSSSERYRQRERNPNMPREKNVGNNPNLKSVGNKKFPWYYYLLFYGTPIIVIISLLGLVIYRIIIPRIAPQTQVEVVYTGPHELWKNAEIAYMEAHVYFQEALGEKDKGRKKSAQIGRASCRERV